MPPIGVIVDQWPALGTDSTTQMNFLLIQELSRRGQEVVVLKPLLGTAESEIQAERRDALSGMAHVQAKSLIVPDRRRARARKYLPEGLLWRRRNWYWQLQCADALAGLMRDANIEFVFAYGDTGLMWLASTVGGAPRRVILGDRPDLPYRHRQHPPFAGTLRFLSPRWWLRWSLVWRLRHDFHDLILQLGEVECVSAAHAEYIRHFGGTASYCRSAVNAGAVAESGAGHSDLRLLMVGNLSATASYEGFIELARGLVPQLASELSSGAVRIRVVGGGIESVPPNDLRAVMRAGVEVLGYVEDLEEQFAWADSLLIPTTIPLGVRIRTIEGWSRGLPTIGHASIALGLPEAENLKNCLLSGDSMAMAIMIKDLQKNPSQLRRLQSSSSDTFGTYFLNRPQEIADELVTP